MTPITLDTPRLRLRPWRADDLAPFAAMNADAEVMRYLPSRLERADSDALVERLQAHIERDGWGLWAVERRADGRFIGFTGLCEVPEVLPCSPGVEIGWRLARAAWGQGHATEAAQAALQFGFERLGLQEVVSFTAVVNQRSQAVMYRLGMSRDAANFEHPRLPPGHELREHGAWRLPVERWRALNGR